MAVVAMGLALRAGHYLQNPPVWHDEAALLLNIVGKSFAELTGPLYFTQAAPPLFLWLQKTLVLLLGDDSLTLRLLPFLAGGAALLLLTELGRRLLPPAGALAFAVLVATSDRLLWHGCEGKPYSTDVLVAAVVLGLALWAANALTPRRLLALALLGPVLLFLSYPACFLLGGVALTLLPAVRRARKPALWLTYLTMLALLGSAFVCLYLGPVRASATPAWFITGTTPSRPGTRPGWSPWWPRGAWRACSATRRSRSAGRCCRWRRSVACSLSRDGRRVLLGFLVWPLALNVLAWLPGYYLLGALCVTVYAAPAVLLLSAAGVVPAWAWLRRRHRLAPLALAALLLAPVGQTAWRLVWPWQRLDAATPAAFVLHARRPDEPVVGFYWEHAYYFRRLGPLYRPHHLAAHDPPAPAPISEADLAAGLARRLWVLTPHGADAERAYLATIAPGVVAHPHPTPLSGRDRPARGVPHRRGPGHAAPNPPPSMTVSVIIPALNEAACLPETLRSLAGQGAREVIVVDGGSTDNTPKAAAVADLTLTAPRGRASQMNAGAAHARGDVLLFLHADCTLEAGALAAAGARLRRRDTSAACFTMTVRRRGAALPIHRRLCHRRGCG